jgi:hypothetical protein
MASLSSFILAGPLYWTLYSCCIASLTTFILAELLHSTASFLLNGFIEQLHSSLATSFFTLFLLMHFIGHFILAA